MKENYWKNAVGQDVKVPSPVLLYNTEEWCFLFPSAGAFLVACFFFQVCDLLEWSFVDLVRKCVSEVTELAYLLISLIASV